MDHESMDQSLRAKVQAVAVAEAELVRTVSDQRTAGRSWAAIGRALGVTRQAAWERFHRAVRDAL